MVEETNMPAVSIIVAVYNQENYLRECLDSIVNQTLKNIEIICVNGGSTDQSLAILEEYANNDSRIKIITGENLGQAHNTNIGIRNATGKYLGTVDSDDYIDSHMYEVLYNKAEEEQLDVVRYNHYYFMDNLIDNVRQIYVRREIIQPYYYDKVSNIQEDRNFFSMCTPVWSGLYRREFILENNIFLNEAKEASYTDNGFIFRVIILAKKVCHINRAMYFYRTDNPNSISRDENPYKKIKCEYDDIRKFLEEDKDRFKTYISMYHYFKYRNYLYIHSITPWEQKDQVMKEIALEYKNAIKNNEIEPELYFAPWEWQNYKEISNIAE